MTKLNYATAGVDIKKGDSASKLAYKNAKTTFDSRAGLIGQPVQLDGGFAGVLDFGDFYVIQNDDGTGSKSEIAEDIEKYDTIGRDLCCTVVDDAICVGAEVVSITNTFDVPSVDPEILDKMSAGLAKACREQKVIMPGGEIAEVPDATKKIVWNATAVGVVKKDKFITGKNIKSGHKIIGLTDPVIRSNGTTLVRKICEQNLGSGWLNEEWKNGITWGEILLTPCKIFHRLLLDNILGDFEGERKFEILGLCHITGGGIAGNVPRILPDGLGANFKNLHQPHQAVKDLQKLGDIDEKECYRTWHCGTAMMIFVEEKNAEKICEILNSADKEVEAKIVGEVTDNGKIELISQFSGDNLVF